jgi:hypothetical protein
MVFRSGEQQVGELAMVNWKAVSDAGDSAENNLQYALKRHTSDKPTSIRSCKRGAGNGNGLCRASNKTLFTIHVIKSTSVPRFKKLT